MFTGIITDIGRVLDVVPTGDRRFSVETAYDTAAVALGASIAHSGICLTVISRASGRYEVQVSSETLELTTARHWRTGTQLNLEQALKVGDELGGHIVSGHVDGVGRIIERRPENDSLRLTIECPASLSPMVATKGSITVDGISLTVNEVEGERFGVNIIPHTQRHTTIGSAKVGDPVNLEVDMLARYVARMLGKEIR